MNTTTAQSRTAGVLLSKSMSGILVAGLLAGLAGCSTTRQVRKDIEPTGSGFLGDTSMLQKGAKDEADYIYIDKSANWAKYTKIWIKPVQLWHADDPDSPLGKLSRENQQMLVNYLYAALKGTLSQEYEMVDHGGPDVLILEAAITDGKKSKPVVDLVSSVYLPLKAISFGKRLITGTDIGVGMAVVEADFRDGQTNQRVAAAIDARAGTKAIRSKFSGTWGDVKLAFDWWAQRTALRLALLKQGDTSTDKL
jgi:Protein of unknown function (DUF3313)